MIKNLKYKIIELLAESDRGLKLNEIAKHLKIKSEEPEYDYLKFFINKLVEEGKVGKQSKRKYVLNKNFDYGYYTPTISGTLRIEYNRGIITDPVTKQKVIIKQKHLNTALDGDNVVVVLLASKKGKKPRGEVTKIIQRSNRKIVGKIEHDGNFWFLVPEDEKYYTDFLIPKSKLNKAKHGDKVTAQFLRWTNPTKNPEAEVLSIFGSSGQAKVEFDSILTEFSLPERFTKAVEDYVKDDKVKITADVLKERLDVRKLEIITIDPADAKDFDDALSLEFLDNGNYYLGVHIADVSHYVQSGSIVDEEAFKRGNSTYLVDRVVPMLPEKLSNDVCSLKPNRIRFAFSVFMELTPGGRVVKYKIHETIIKSSKRFSYEEVLKIIETKQGPKADLVLALNKLAQKLRSKRLKEGGINFETSEIRFKLDKDGMPQSAYEKTSNLATQLVEECMLIANRTVAENLYRLISRYRMKTELPFVFRVHEKPDREKLQSVLTFIMRLGHKGDARSGQAKAINKLLAQFENRPEKALVNNMIIRAMPRAVYSPDNIGHYGLGFKNYTHFTSPIRRYADLVVHRLTKEYSKSKPNKRRISHLLQLVDAVSERTSMTERLSMEAERASAKLASCMLAKNYVGAEMWGTISGVVSFGLFVRLDDIYGEGLLHIRDLVDDFYEFDERNFRLVGRRKKNIFGFGDRVRVKIVFVSVEKRKIDLQLSPEK